jgi:hypothetical protein
MSINLPTGKRVGKSLYAQMSALLDGETIATPRELKIFRKVIDRTGFTQYDLVCIEEQKDRIRFLRMDDLANPHPTVIDSLVIHYNDVVGLMITGGILNGQIYHRMDRIIDSRAPTYTFHRAVVEYEEAIGALGPFKIYGKSPSGYLHKWIEQLNSEHIDYVHMMDNINNIQRSLAN